MHAVSVSVLAKEPRPGFVKTRLCPPLVPAQAAELAGVFATDTMESLLPLAARRGFELRLVLDGEDDGPLASVAVDLGIPVARQGDGDLGSRMGRVLRRGLAGARACILIGADTPDLPPDLVESAVEALGRVDVVLSPARDGGYVLVGARRDIDGLFRIEADWGGPGVFDATCEALRRRGCAFEVLAPWEDVDDAAALGRLAIRLQGSDGAAAPRTARLLGQWRSQGVRF